MNNMIVAGFRLRFSEPYFNLKLKTGHAAPQDG
jgi:hypothetical protein